MNAPARPTATTVCNDLAYNAIVETCELAASYARSAAEAAYRGDRQLLAGHLDQLRACVETALHAQRRLGPPAREKAA